MSEIMNWYMITFKDGSTEIFRAHAADYNNGSMISFFGVVFSDYEAEYYHVNPTEIRSSKELVTGEVINELAKAIGN